MTRVALVGLSATALETTGCEIEGMATLSGADGMVAVPLASTPYACVRAALCKTRWEQRCTARGIHCQPLRLPSVYNTLSHATAQRTLAVYTVLGSRPVDRQLVGSAQEEVTHVPLPLAGHSVTL